MCHFLLPLLGYVEEALEVVTEAQREPLDRSLQSQSQHLKLLSDPEGGLLMLPVIFCDRARKKAEKEDSLIYWIQGNLGRNVWAACLLADTDFGEAKDPCGLCEELKNLGSGLRFSWAPASIQTA